MPTSPAGARRQPKAVSVAPAEGGRRQPKAVGGRAQAWARSSFLRDFLAAFFGAGAGAPLVPAPAARGASAAPAAFAGGEDGSRSSAILAARSVFSQLNSSRPK